jgi:hypothetical protein
MKKILDVPYKSQWDDDARATQNDCGPASAAMIIASYGENHSIDDIFYKSGAGLGYVNFDQMRKAVQYYGFKYAAVVDQTKEQLISLIDQGIPPIALIHYKKLEGRQDQGFGGAHFLVVKGYDDNGVYLNDPDWWDERRNEGNGFYVSWSEFMEAWGTCYLDGNLNNQLIVIYPKVQAAAVAATTVTSSSSEKDAAVILDRILNHLSEEVIPDPAREIQIKALREGKDIPVITALKKLISDLESNEARATITDKICIDYLQMPTSENVTYEMIKTALDARITAALNETVSVGTYQAMETERNRYKELYEGAIISANNSNSQQEQETESPANPLPETIKPSLSVKMPQWFTDFVNIVIKFKRKNG